MKATNNSTPDWMHAREIWKHDFHNGDVEERLGQLDQTKGNRIEQVSDQALSGLVSKEMLEEILRTKNVLVFINNLRKNYEFFYEEEANEELLWQAAHAALEIQENISKHENPTSVAVTRRKISSDLKNLADTDNEELVRVYQVMDKMFEYSLSETAAESVDIDPELVDLVQENVLGRIRNIRRAGLQPLFKERLRSPHNEQRN